MNNRWTIQEESNLLKSIASGKTCKDLTGGFNRSENALELRLKKIIYENISKGKEPERIATLLNYPKDKVMQYFYSYKDYINKQEQKGGNNINNDNKISQLEKINNLPDINQIKSNNIQQNNMSGGNKLDSIEKQNKHMKLLIENYILKQKLSKIVKAKNNDLYRESIKTILG
jgi:hypothetical protein